MTRSIIPWHVFNDAIETTNPYHLNLWLQRWRFMDAGVILFDANIPALQIPNTIFNLLREKTESDGSDSANEISDSPESTSSANKRNLNKAA